MEPDALALLAAARLRMGGRRLRALAMGDAEDVRRFVQSDSAQRLAEARRDARGDATVLEGLGARLVRFGGPGYPASLRDLRDPPPLLFVRGTLPEQGVAIIGARDASGEACAFAGAFTAALAAPLVSGLAHGVDAAAHRAAIAAGLPQVAYVGTGLASVYPPEHAELAERIVACGGALASERLPLERVTTWSLVRRDRLQAAHASVVVLIESDVAGGAMHTMRFARELQRARFALDAPAGGNRRAIAEGAAVLPWNASLAAALVRAALRSQESAVDRST